MEPTVVVGGALLLLMMLGGKKKKSNVGPLQPGDKPTPLPPGNQKGGSDPLPPGSRGGHLPKGKGYRPPAGMSTTDIWVSPDCQAWLVGEDWYPTFEDQDAYTAFKAAYTDVSDPRVGDWVSVVMADFDRAVDEAVEQRGPAFEFITYDGQKYEPDMWSFPGYLVGYFPTGTYSPADAFTLGVMTEISPLCAETIPLFEQYDTEEEWSDAYDAWIQAYPALDDLMRLIRDSATVGDLPEGQNVALSKTPGGEQVTYVGARNMRNAWSDSVGAIGSAVEAEPWP